MNRIITLLLLTYFFPRTLSIAQVPSPPSLAIGLSGLTGEKGNIDVALLSEIISEKQQEVKKEFIKRSIYQNLENKSYALWELGYNSGEMLLNSKDKKSIEKKLMEYASNLALVYGFAEGYLQASVNVRQNTHLLKIIQSCTKENIDTAEQRKFLALLIPTKSKMNISYKGKKKDTIKTKEELIESMAFGDLPALNIYLNKLKPKGKSDYPINLIFLDMIFDILKNEKELQKIGFFQSSIPFDNEYYESHNLYLRFINDKNNKNSELVKNLKTLRERIAEEVQILINNFYLASDIVNSKGKSIESLCDELSKISFTGINYDTFDNIYNELSPAFVDKQNFNYVEFKKYSDQLLIATRFLKELKNRDANVNDLYFIREKLAPFFSELTLNFKLDKKYITMLNLIGQKILLDNLNAIKKKIASSKLNSQLDKIDVTLFSGIIDLISNLHKLDVAKTYEYVLKLIKFSGNILPEKDAVFVNTITDNIEKYTIINQDSNKVELAVEDIILQLYEKIANRQNSVADFYFSIGMNQTFKINYQQKYKYLWENNMIDTLNNLSYASEKIGLKLKYDIKAHRFKTQNFKSKEPLISDLHFIAYGSGILYNIVNTTTNKNFKYAIIGLSPGLSFYNGIDLNFFVNFPLVTNEKLSESIQRRQFCGVSFDIKIGEYITALRRKNKSKS